MPFSYGPLGNASRMPKRPLYDPAGLPGDRGITTIARQGLPARTYDPVTRQAGLLGSVGGGGASVVPAAAAPTPPPITPNNPYYSPGQTYGLENGTLPYLGDGQYTDTDIGRGDVQDNQVAYYLRQLGQYDPYSEQGRFMESQAQRVIQGYEQARLTNPELFFRDYVDDSGIMGQLDRRFNLASPEALGMNYARYAPPASTVPRGF